jgi:cell division initiation protein
MELTALDIKQQTFARTLRGYDIAEVNAYLQVLSTRWEHMVGKSRELEREIDELRDKLKHYARVEEALHETLQTAKENAEQKLTTSRKEAQRILEKAELEAEEILRSARQERQIVKNSMQRLLERRDEIIRGMTSYLELSRESLENFKRDESNVYNVPSDEVDARDQAAMSRASGADALPRKSRLGNIGAPRTITPGEDEIDDLVDSIE